MSSGPCHSQRRPSFPQARLSPLPTSPPTTQLPLLPVTVNLKSQEVRTCILSPLVNFPRGLIKYLSIHVCYLSTYRSKWWYQRSIFRMSRIIVQKGWLIHFFPTFWPTSKWPTTRISRFQHAGITNIVGIGLHQQLEQLWFSLLLGDAAHTTDCWLKLFFMEIK